MAQRRDLENLNAAKAVGPFYNQIIAAYPTWYYDISVPTGKALEFRFIKKDSAGNVVWESETNHTFTTPSSG
ncbi:hypothetical protein ABID52_000162 [Fictibacillus halophilus]|uniref:CBM20 domain-containing protein n=1 Tax=Fictibacillus halophilus TaxID=1610490 RepID=A0ABV2LDA7_9BACL|nr:carbohydrate-binding module family 20 domain-containing protein [Fictibacillus halophilus]